jgi:hypothetical protein
VNTVETDVANTWTVGGQRIEADDAKTPGLSVRVAADDGGRGLTVRHVNDSVMLDVISFAAPGLGPTGHIPMKMVPCGYVGVSYESNPDYAWTFQSYYSFGCFAVNNAYTEYVLGRLGTADYLIAWGLAGTEYEVEGGDLPKGEGPFAYCYVYGVDQFPVVVNGLGDVRLGVTGRKMSFFGCKPVDKPVVTGTKQDANTLAGKLLAALVALNLVTDKTA